MFTDKGQCRPLMDFKGFDWAAATDEERMELALADVNEAGMSHNELRAILLGLNSFGKKPLVTVETGLGYGFSTRIFLTHAAKYGGEHHIFESLPGPRPIIEMLKELDLWKYATLHVGDARKAVWPEDKMIDFLNIDSEHSLGFVMNEYMRFRMNLTNGSVVGFHDVDCCWGVRRGIAMIREIDRIHLLCDESRHAGAGYQCYIFRGHDRPDCNYWRRFTGDESFYADEGVDTIPNSPYMASELKVIPFREPETKVWQGSGGL